MMNFTTPILSENMAVLSGDAPEIEAAAESAAGENSSLKLMRGKKVFEILPDIDWDKGRAIRWMLEAMKLSFKEASVVYIGDDTTDERKTLMRTIISR